MHMNLEKADGTDVIVLHEMQKKSFQPILDVYQDYETNPANEKVETIKRKMNNGTYYKIFVEQELVGAVRVVVRNESHWISPIFILPEYQGKGIAQQAMLKIEELYAEAKTWELETILQEKGHCYLYEKLGYKLTGHEVPINERMTLVHYIKNVPFTS